MSETTLLFHIGNRKDTHMIRKVGGIYFWNIGRIGGSFYLKKREQDVEPMTAGEAIFLGFVSVVNIAIWGVIIIEYFA